MPRSALRLSAAAASIVILSLTWGVAPGNAEGPLYAVPSNPPPVTESVGFTNALNERVRQLPAPLNPPAALSTAQVDARVKALERGVVIGRGARRPKVHSGVTGTTVVKASDDGGTHSHGAAGSVDDRAPLSIAFVAAGALALLGLLLGARGKYSGSAQQA